jgi:hypothetical protein
LSASGAINEGITSENPSTARIHTDYDLDDAGDFTSSNLGSTLTVFASNADQGQHKAATWDGAPNPLVQQITISVDAATPVGTYPLHITNAAQAGRVTITNPSGLTPNLSDKAFSIDVEVVAPAGGDPDYEFIGFYQPVNGNSNDDNGFFITAKAGQGVALKWNLEEDGEEVVDNLFSVSSKRINCDLTGTGDDTPVADDSGKSDLRWDEASGQWVFVWKTLKNWANTCRTFELSYDSTLVAELDVHFTK